MAERETKKKNHIEGEIEKERKSVIVSKQAILRYFSVSSIILLYLHAGLLHAGFFILWFCLMDESGREIIVDVVSEPDLSSDEYV
jgi:hypothetical protein